MSCKVPSTPNHSVFSRKKMQHREGRKAEVAGLWGKVEFSDKEVEAEQGEVNSRILQPQLKQQR